MPGEGRLEVPEPGSVPPTAAQTERAAEAEALRVAPVGDHPLQDLAGSGAAGESAADNVGNTNEALPAADLHVPAASPTGGDQPVAGGAAAEEDDDDRPIVIGRAPVAEKPAPKRRKAAEAAVESKSEEPKSDKLEWYILKVQSNREESIREGLLRRVAIAGLDKYFGEIIVPTEKVTEVKGGRKRVTKRKLYPGYLVVHMEINDDTWFLVRETPGIGDFTGAAGRPAPMLPQEVSRIIAKQEEKSEKAPKLNIGFKPGDAVKINEGTFENFEGHVESIDQQNGRVTVMINIFGRSTPVELEYWQIGAV